MCCLFSYCWRGNGIHEKRKPEVISSWRDILANIVLRVRSTSIKSDVCIFTWIRCICCTSCCDGIPVLEVWENISCRCCVPCVFRHGWWLLSWNSSWNALIHVGKRTVLVCYG